MRLMRLVILFFIILCCVPALAMAADSGVARCVNIRLDHHAASRIGFALKQMKTRDIDVTDAPVTIQPRMAGLLGPRVTFLGRDVRLAVITGQSSPQELWRKAQWNKAAVDCPYTSTSWRKSLKRGVYWNATFENTLGFTTYDPKILYRTRYVAQAMFVRPYGFTFGGALSLPVATNTESLLYLPDDRPAVRRDMARFSNGGGVERLYASWRTTPITDLHVSVSAGNLEEMYGGVGAEAVYRPFGSAFWIGADGWQTWRRDPFKAFNFAWTNEQRFTGHARLGYDMPDSRFGVRMAAGRYLAGDTGLTLEALQGFENGARLSGALTWTNRDEAEGFFKNNHFDPMVRLVWPLSKSGRYKTATHFQQVGRDGGQMLNRPQPLEDMTERFSGREIIRHWAGMLE